MFPSPGDLPNLGIEPRCPTLQADSLPSKSPTQPQKREMTIEVYALQNEKFRLIMNENECGSYSFNWLL